MYKRQETVLAAREKAVAQLDAAARLVLDTGDQVKRLRRELDEASKAQSRAQEDHRRARAALDRVDVDAREAQQRLAEATERLDQLARRQTAP